jgi:hypothetical protein
MIGYVIQEVWEHSTEKNIWTKATGIKRRLAKITQ